MSEQWLLHEFYVIFAGAARMTWGSLDHAGGGGEKRAMEIEINARAKDKWLNRAVAITVVTLSVIMALGNIMDDNVVQNMQQAKSDSVDGWNEYQATRTRARVVDAALSQTAILTALPATAATASKALASADAESIKYAREAP